MAIVHVTAPTGNVEHHATQIDFSQEEGMSQHARAMAEMKTSVNAPQGGDKAAPARGGPGKSDPLP